MFKKSHELVQGDVIRLLICGEVVAARPVGKRHVKIRIALEDQGRRSYAGGLNTNPKNVPLQFTGDGTVEFICYRSRGFGLLDWWDDDDGGDLEDVPPDSGPEWEDDDDGDLVPELEKVR